MFFWPYIMIIGILARILNKKKSTSMHYLNPQFLLLLLLPSGDHLQKAGPSFWQPRKGQEKCIFEILHIEIKCVLSVKESNFNEKRIKIFTFAYSQGQGGWPSPPLYPDEQRRNIGIIWNPELFKSFFSSSAYLQWAADPLTMLPGYTCWRQNGSSQ